MCFTSWLEWKKLKSACDMWYNIVCDSKICYRICFYLWETADLLTLAGALVSKIYLMFFCRTQCPDILSCLLQNTDSALIIHFLFLYYNAEALDCKQPLYFIQIFIYSLSSLMLQKLIHHFHLLFHQSVLAFKMFSCCKSDHLFDTWSFTPCSEPFNTIKLFQIEFGLRRRYH